MLTRYIYLLSGFISRILVSGKYNLSPHFISNEHLSPQGVVRDCVSKNLYSSVIFFADKVAALTSDPADIYMQAQALFLGRHYRRDFHLLNASHIVHIDPCFRYLAAKCHEELKEWDQCLLMLGEAKVDEHGNVSNLKDSHVMYLDKDGQDREINILSAICFLRGKAYKGLENRAQARQWYKAAIKADPLCYGALECLIDKQMLTCEEETSLLSSLQFGAEDGWIASFYSCLIKKYENENVVQAKFRELEDESCVAKPFKQSLVHTLNNNTDLLACKAEYFHQYGEYQKCFELTSVLLEKDPFHLKCMMVHLAIALELGQSNELYLMSCNLVKDYPQMALSWFAVGCYYYCIKKYAESRRYFNYDSGWIVFSSLDGKWKCICRSRRGGSSNVSILYCSSFISWVSFTKSVHWDGIHENSQLQTCRTVLQAGRDDLPFRSTSME